eukprot:5078982-Amphidinium_carterae.1
MGVAKDQGNKWRHRQRSHNCIPRQTRQKLLFSSKASLAPNERQSTHHWSTKVSALHSTTPANNALPRRGAV